MKTMKIGIFGGSFDPVHREHVRLAEAAVRGLSLDRLIVVPAGSPPHKQNRRLALPGDRIAMCRLAFRDVEKAEICEFEVSQQGASYTYLTCDYIAHKYPGARLFLLVGTDMFWDFFHWKNPEIILSYANLAVCRRNESVENIAKQQEAFYKAYQRNFDVIPYNGEEVSSTEIRTRSVLGMDYSSLVHPDVEQYIRSRGLYSMPPVLQGLAQEKPARAEHSRRVCLLATGMASRYGLDETKTLVASALHDVSKNLAPDHPWLKGFVPPKDVPAPVMHQYSGAYVLEHSFGVRDEDILNAVRYHTSGRPGMSTLEKVVYLADLLEPARDFAHIGELRELFKKDLDRCMYLSLRYETEHLVEKGTPIYPLTLQAYNYYRRGQQKAAAAAGKTVGKKTKVTG